MDVSLLSDDELAEDIGLNEDQINMFRNPPIVKPKELPNNQSTNNQGSGGFMINPMQVVTHDTQNSNQRIITAQVTIAGKPDISKNDKVINTQVIPIKAPTKIQPPPLKKESSSMNLGSKKHKHKKKKKKDSKEPNPVKVSFFIPSYILLCLSHMCIIFFSLL